jgi:hypothetical protein
VCGKPSPLAPITKVASNEQPQDATAIRTTEEPSGVGGVWLRRKPRAAIGPQTQPSISSTSHVRESSQERETAAKTSRASGVEPPHVNPSVIFGVIFLLVAFLIVGAVYARASALLLLGIVLVALFAIVISIPLYLRHASGGRALQHGRSYLICPECYVRLYAGSPIVPSWYGYYRRDPERHAASVLRWHLINKHHYSREKARKIAAKAEFMHDDK